MRTKKVQKTPFQQKLSEKLEASSERMLAKMESANDPATVETAKPGRKAKSSTRTDKQREYARRYQAKRRAAKQDEKEQAKSAREENEANDARAYVAAVQVQPTPKRENVADALKDFFVRSCSAEIFKTEVEVMLNESNHYYKRLVNFYRTQAETKDAIIDEQARHLDRLNDMIQKQRSMPDTFPRLRFQDRSDGT